MKKILAQASLASATLLTAAMLFGTPANAQDVAAGERSFNKCRACHQIGETAKNTVGPVLNGLIGRHTGSVEGYSYSAALRAQAFTWDKAHLDAWLSGPKALVPGTKMTFLGFTDPKDRADVIAYLATATAE